MTHASCWPDYTVELYAASTSVLFENMALDLHSTNAGTLFKAAPRRTKIVRLPA